jgi:muramoyltetrapeptide carboxypeptidase
MPLVNAAELVKAAHKGHYCIGAFNTNNLEWTRAILAGAQELNVPVIIQSDLTTILTALAKNGNQAVNVQLRNCLVNKDLLKSGYFDRLLAGKEAAKELDELEVTFVRGSEMAGPVYGGNLRCLLKLAGTPYWPDFTGSILLLEAYRGQPELVASLLEQCWEIGIFNQISGVLLGTFSELDKLKESQLPAEILLDLLPAHVPIAKTEFIGHRPDAKAIRLGQECVFKEVGV